MSFAKVDANLTNLLKTKWVKMPPKYLKLKQKLLKKKISMVLYKIKSKN